MVRFQITVVLISFVIAGCGRGADAYHPRSAVQQYVHYIKTNNAKGAYQLLSKELRSRLSFEAFARKWRKNRAELQIQAAHLFAGVKQSKGYEVSARIKLSGRRRVTLAHEDNRWRILGGVGSGFDSLSPREAVLGLVRALESKNFPTFLKLLTKSRRERFIRAITSRLEKLKANLDRDFEITGNRARLQYDPQYWIMLVKENGVWKVVEFN